MAVARIRTSGVAVALVMLGIVLATAPVGADSDSDPAAPGYVTVVVEENNSDPDAQVTDFTVTWNDPENCTDGYSAYITGWKEIVVGEGSTSSDGVQIAMTVPHSDFEGGYGYTVPVFCGVRDSGRRLRAARVPEKNLFIPIPGTYSSEPGLTGLTASQGSLAPSFHQYRFFDYTLEEVPSDAKRVTLNAKAKAGYSVVFLGGEVDLALGGCNQRECDFGYSEAGTEDGKLESLEDADKDLAGFQMDLADDQTHFTIHAHPVLSSGDLYIFSLERASSDESDEPQNQDPEDVPLTAGFSDLDLPGSHNGQDAFTFRLAFSEAVNTSYKTLRDHSFQVTGGAVERAKRVDKRSDLWQITVQPDSSNNVTVVLLATEDCEAPGAVCTEDGRPLSNRVELTVTGPPGSVQNTLATGEPTVSGVAQVGGTLTVDTSGISDADGMDNVAYNYQWLANDGKGDGDTEGATTSTYTLVSEDERKTVKVRVSFSDDLGNEETLTSEATAAVEPAPNSEATGLPTISGAAQVGETLTVDMSGISDADGLANATFGYQWIAAAHISGATEANYTLVDTDVGKTIKVRVTFTDDANHEETLTSEATDAVSGPPPEPLTARVENTPEAHDGENAFTFELRFSEELDLSYKTLRDHAFTVDGGTVKQARRLAKPSNIHWEITVRPDSDAEVVIVLPVTEDCNAQGAVCTADGRPLSNRVELTVTGPQSAVQNAPATGLPTFDGTAQVGETLTVDTSGIADADGLANVSYSYQWLSSRNTEIQGATGSTYTLVPADAGKTIKVRVTFTDDAGNEETLTSAPAETVDVSESHDRPYNLQSTVAEGAITLTWQDPDTHPSHGLYHILRHRPELGEDKPFVYVEYTPSTDRTFTDSAVEPGVLYVYAVKAMKDYFGYLGPASAPVRVRMPTGESVEAPNTPATGAPTISGTAQVGETLTADTSGIADTDGLDDATFSYQWVSNNGTTDTDITGATGSTYTLVGADEGKTVKVRVSFTDDAENEETLTSAATAAVAAKANSPATGAPTISGTAQVGETLAADTSGIADTDGLSNATFSYQWVSNNGTTDTDITGATDSTYTLVSDDEGRTVKVKVSFTDDAGNPETLTSTATDTVAAKPNSPATGAPTISGTAQVGETLATDTSGIADTDGLENAAFSYQWVSNNGTTDTDITGATDSTYALVGSDEGKTVKVRVSFTDDTGNPESLTSAATAAVALVPTSEEETEEDGPIWSATMTAGLLNDGYGYSSFAGGAGELSETEFELDGVTYTIKAVVAWGWMYIAVDKELPIDFTLEVDGKQFDSRDASLTSYSYANLYMWEDAQLEWAEGNTIELALYRSD